MSQLDFKTSQSPASAGSGPLDPLAKSLQPEIPLETSHWLPKDYHFDPRSLKTSFENDTTALENPAGCLSKGYVCSIQGCENPLDTCYYRKYKICEEHAKSPAVTIGGIPLRFCQKCGRFQDLAAFDGARRSCRRALEAHNKRRRAKHSHSRDKSLRRTKKEKLAVSKLPSVTAQQQSKSSIPSQFLHATDQGGDVGVVKSLLELEERFGIPDVENEHVSFGSLGPMPTNHIEYQTEHAEQTLSLKFHGSSPSDLPKDILTDIQSHLLMNPSAAFFEGAIRPGCTHLSLRIRAREGKEADQLRSLATESLATNLAKVWRSHSKTLFRGMEVQMGGSVTHVGSDGSSFTVRSLPEMLVFPSVVESLPMTEFEIVMDDVDLQGRTIAAFCRQNGKYLTTSIVHDEDKDFELLEETTDPDSLIDDDMDMRLEADATLILENDVDSSLEGSLEDDTARSCSAESSRSVSGRNSIGSDDTMDRHESDFVGESRRLVRVLGLTPGSCEIELMVDSVLTAPVSVLVLPTNEHVMDARRLLDGSTRAQSAGFIRDAGMVVRHVFSPESLISSDLPTVQRLAVKTCEWAMESRSTHLVRILQEALPPENACCEAADPTHSPVFGGNDHSDTTFGHAGHSKSKPFVDDELHLAFPASMAMNPGKLYDSYELEAERAIVQELCEEVSRLSFEEKKTLRGMNSWMSVAAQLIFGVGLFVLASSGHA